MAKVKISEFNSNPALNTDIDSINLAEGCAPSGINDAIRELMAQLKDFQTGAVGDSFNGPVGTTTAATGAFTTLTTTGTINNLTVGRGAGAVSTNTAVGASALAANTTGFNNTALGQIALATNTGGAFNTAIGRAALNASTGDYNTALGGNTLVSNSSGANNTGLGAQALYSNTTASNNTAVGYQAGYSNTTGSSISAFGYAALTANTTGAGNTGIGTNALLSNTTGGQNIALGQGALQSNTTASSNTAVGYQAGYSNTTNSRSTYIGNVAGYTATGESNTAVGSHAGFYMTTGNNNTLIGGRSATGSNAGAGFNLTTGTYNNFFGSSAGGEVTTGSKNTILGNYTGNQGGLDIRTASNYIVLSDGDGNPRAYWAYDGSFNCIGVYNATTASAANTFVGSNGYLYRSTSALKYKQDIRNLEEMDISLLRPVRYKSKCEGDDQTKDHLGLIADEAADAGFEELVTRGATGEVEGFQYERLTVVLLKELQTLRARVAQLEQGA